MTDDVLFLRYGVQQTEFFVIWTTFCPFTHLTTQKINILKKWKNCKAILSFHSCIPKMTFIWCMVPEMLRAMDRIFCHFGPFFFLYPLNNLQNPDFEKMKQLLGDIIISHMCTINDNHDVWFLRYGAWHTEFFVILDHFLPFYTSNNLKNQNFEKMK